MTSNLFNIYFFCLLLWWMFNNGCVDSAVQKSNLWLNENLRKWRLDDLGRSLKDPETSEWWWTDRTTVVSEEPSGALGFNSSARRSQNTWTGSSLIVRNRLCVSPLTHLRLHMLKAVKWCNDGKLFCFPSITHTTSRQLVLGVWPVCWGGCFIAAAYLPRRLIGSGVEAALTRWKAPRVWATVTSCPTICCWIWAQVWSLIPSEAELPDPQRTTEEAAN